MKKIILAFLIGYSSLTHASDANCELAAYKRLMYEISLSMNAEELPLNSLIVEKLFRYYTRPSRDGSQLRHEYKVNVLINDVPKEFRYPVFELLDSGECN